MIIWKDERKVISVTTKEKICSIASELFNTKGYENVSLREIAKESEMSLGTLTYHFKKKEDLVMAIVSQLQDSYSFYFSSELYGVDLLRDFIHSFVVAEENKKLFPFYFKNINEIVSKSEQFIELNNNFQKNLHNFYLSCFLVLQEENIIKECFSLDHLYVLSFSLTSLVATWSTLSSPSHNNQFRIMSLPYVACTLIAPYLNDEYQDIAKEYINNYKII